MKDQIMAVCKPATDQTMKVSKLAKNKTMVVSKLATDLPPSLNSHPHPYNGSFCVIQQNILGSMPPSAEMSSTAHCNRDCDGKDFPLFNKTNMMVNCPSYTSYVPNIPMCKHEYKGIDHLNEPCRIKYITNSTLDDDIMDEINDMLQEGSDLLFWEQEELLPKRQKVKL